MWIFSLMRANENWELLRNVPTKKTTKKGEFLQINLVYARILELRFSQKLSISFSNK